MVNNKQEANTTMMFIATLKMVLGNLKEN